MATLPLPNLPSPVPFGGVLVASADRDLRDQLVSTLNDRRCPVVIATGGADALGKLESSECDVLLLDGYLPDLDCDELMRIVELQYPGVEILRIDPKTRSLVGTPKRWRHGLSDVFRTCVSSGDTASDPGTVVDPEAGQAVEALPGMVGADESMKKIYRAVRLVARRSTTVLITGFLGRLPDVTYLCSLNVTPIAASAVLQLDLQLAFPIIDLLLGGVGAPVTEVRQATEIEEELLAGIVKIIAREFAAGWSTVGFDITFDERQLPAAAQRLMRPTEKTLVVSFELRIPEVRGMLIVAFPAVVANAFLRKLLREPAPKAKATSAPEEQIRDLLLDCPFPVHLEIFHTQVRLRDLIEMTPGTVLPFRHTVRDPIVVSAGNVQLFQARPVRTERFRGAQLHEPLQLTAGGDGHEQ